MAVKFFSKQSPETTSTVLQSQSLELVAIVICNHVVPSQATRLSHVDKVLLIPQPVIGGFIGEDLK